MKDLSEAKQELVKSLVKNKKFHQLEFEVNSLLLEKRSPFLLNLLVLINFVFVLIIYTYTLYANLLRLTNHTVKLLPIYHFSIFCQI